MNDENQLIKKMLYHKQQICQLWNKGKFGGDPFSYARFKELEVALILDHNLSITYAGSDGEDSQGNKCEYKTTINNKGWKYSGISVKDSWEEQVTYIKDKKIGIYKHYLAKYNQSGMIDEVWELTSESVLKILLPKIKNNFDKQGKTRKGTAAADPRLAANITNKEAQKYGIKVYPRNRSSTSLLN